MPMKMTRLSNPHYVTIALIHPKWQLWACRYKITVQSDKSAVQGWSDYDFAYTRWGAKQVAKKLIKTNEGSQFQPRVVEDYYI